MNKLLAKLYSVQLPDLSYHPDTDSHGCVMAERNDITEITFKAYWNDFLQLGDPAKLIESHQWFEIRPSMMTEIRVGRDFKLSIALSREMAKSLVTGLGDGRSVLMNGIISRLEEVIRTPEIRTNEDPNNEKGH